MMDVVPAKDKSISAVNEKDGMIFLKSQEGILRIIPEKGGIVRVSFSLDGAFDKEQGSEYADFAGSIDYSVNQDANKIAITTCEGKVHGLYHSVKETSLLYGPNESRGYRGFGISGKKCRVFSI